MPAAALERLRRAHAGRRVLLVEDNPVNGVIAAELLRRAGLLVRTVTDGDGAIDAARAGRFDLVLMDVRMPRMTGYDACRALKADEATRDIPVVFLSAKGQEAEVQTGLEVGAADYILKPFSPDQLTKRVSEILAQEH